MAGRDGDWAHGKTSAKTGFFYEPRGSEFYFAFSGCILRDFLRGASGALRDLGDQRGRDDGILEERPCALAVRAALSDEHSLLFANGTHGVVDLAECGLVATFDLLGEVAFYVSVAQGGLSVGVELVKDGGDDVAATRIGVEEAAPVAEMAGFMVKIDELLRFEIVGANLGDRLGDLLAVGTYVLDWRASDVSWDSGEAFDSGVVVVHRVEDEVIPGLSRACFEQNAVPFPAPPLRGFDGDAHHETIEACVAYKQIAAPA